MRLFPLEDPHIDVDEDLRPLFEPPPEDGDGSQKDGAADFLPLFEPPPEPQKDGAADFLPLFEPPEPQKDLEGGAGPLFLLPFAGGDVLDTGCESGELCTRSTTYRFPQLRFRFF